MVTVRDLARQLPSSWQQELKSGKTDDYLDYLRRLQADERSTSARRHPWIHLDPAAVLSRWAKVVPPERIHVVTVPPSGSSPSLLLERFCRVLEIDPARLVQEQDPSNTSLGRVQAEVLRRVNHEMPEELLRRQVYGDVGKRFFSAQVLASQDARPIRVPEEFRAWCVGVAAAQVTALTDAGYAVEGSLEDLRCPDSAFSEDAVDPTDAEVSAAAVSALVQILTLRGRAALRRRPPGRRGRLVAAVRRGLRRQGSTGDSWEEPDAS